MTENEARQVLLLQAYEAAGEHPHWTSTDRRWATQQAVAVVGEQAKPAAFVAARAGLALQRLLPRDPSAQRWLQRRAWHPAWLAMAVLGGVVLGLAADQLGPPQRVNLLAPAVWAVVAWNLVVYLGLLLPGNAGTLRQWLAAWGLGRAGAGASAAAGGLWAPLALPLSLHRWAACLHTASAALALGLMAGLYLRGLVLDYRAGWQSTFLDAASVQNLLGVLLAPASWLTGVAVPELAPLQLSGGQNAQASAAPWIHLYAATLALVVVAPRALLALGAWARARHLSQRFALPLDTPYFESLHPLMQPRRPRAVRLLWVEAEAGAVSNILPTLFDTSLPSPWPQTLTLLRSEEGDELVLNQAPRMPTPVAPVDPAHRPWWRRLSGLLGLVRPDPAQQTMAALQAQTDLVLLVLGTPQTATPAWLAQLGRPVVAMQLGPPQTDSPLLSAQDLADGWLPQGRLLAALMQALPDDPRLLRLQSTWRARQQVRLDACMAVLATGLAQMATSRVPLANGGLLTRRADAEAARSALALRLQQQLQDTAAAQAAWVLPPVKGAQRAQGAQALTQLDTGAPHEGRANGPTAALRQRVGEGRSAVMGGMAAGALAGFKADVLSGGLTLGAGLLAGGLLGALGGAGLARGLNVVRGTDSSHAAWDDDAMPLIVETLLVQHLGLVHGLDEARAQAALAPELERLKKAFASVWRSRQRGLVGPAVGQADHPMTPADAPKTEQEALASLLQPLLQPLLLDAVQAALGRAAVLR